MYKGVLAQVPRLFAKVTKVYFRDPSIFGMCDITQGSGYPDPFRMEFRLPPKPDRQEGA
jgi:hypothetical protein